MKTELTKKEIQVTQLFAEGGTYKVVAAEMEISPNTVRNHLSSCRDKLGAKSVAHLVALALSKGIINHICILLIALNIIASPSESVRRVRRTPVSRALRMSRTGRTGWKNEAALKIYI